MVDLLDPDQRSRLDGEGVCATLTRTLTTASYHPLKRFKRALRTEEGARTIQGDKQRLIFSGGWVRGASRSVSRREGTQNSDRAGRMNRRKGRAPVMYRDQTKLR